MTRTLPPIRAVGGSASGGLASVRSWVFCVCGPPWWSWALTGLGRPGNRGLGRGCWGGPGCGEEGGKGARRRCGLVAAHYGGGGAWHVRVGQRDGLKVWPAGCQVFGEEGES